jgi:hypothetical protein
LFLCNAKQQIIQRSGKFLTKLCGSILRQMAFCEAAWIYDLDIALPNSFMLANPNVFAILMNRAMNIQRSINKFISRRRKKGASKASH